MRGFKETTPLVLSLVLIAALPRAMSQCYYPDGTTLANDLPCNSSAAVSSCCGKNAFCLDNGLCLAAGVVSRGSCTDSGWGDGCAPYCSSSAARDNPIGGSPLQPCDPFSQTWICGWNSSDCLTNNNTFIMEGGSAVVLRADQVAPLEGGQSEAMVISPSTTLTAVAQANNGSTPSTHTVTTTATTSPTLSGLFTAGQMAGLGAGIGVPLLLALLGALFVIGKQRKKLRHSTAVYGSGDMREEKTSQHNGWLQSPQGSYQNPSPHSQPLQYAYTPSSAVPSHTSKYDGLRQQTHVSAFREMDTSTQFNELGTEHQRQELDGHVK